MKHLVSGIRSFVRRWVLMLASILLACGAAYALTSGADGSGPGVGASSNNRAVVQAPTGHPRIVRPADLDDARAEAIYRAIRDRLTAAYGMSNDPVAQAYVTWRRLNRHPYQSAQHGDRYVNNYANDIARNYGPSRISGPLPVGSQVAKDSFIVTRAGDILMGPLALMEKMPPGFDAATGDWRYMMIDANGNVVGMTGGLNADRMKFCNECHVKAPPGQDRLFFVPGRARLTPATR